MAPRTKSIQSQETIDVSHDYLSDGALPQSPSPREAHLPAPTNDSTGERVEESLTDTFLDGTTIAEVQPAGTAEDLGPDLPLASRRDESTQRVEVTGGKSRRSFVSKRRSSQPPTDVYAQDGNQDSPRQDLRETSTVMVREQQPKAHINTRLDGDTQALGTRLYSSATAVRDVPGAVQAADTEANGEEDLYGATPERKTHTSPPKPSQRTVATIIALSVAPLFPAAKEAEVETPACQTARPEPAPHSELQQPARSISDKSAASIATSRVASVSSHTTLVPSDSMAGPSIGKLVPVGGAMAALRGRKQNVLGRPSDASEKMFEDAAAKNDPLPTKKSAKAVKAKDNMKESSVAPTKATSNTKTLQDLAADKSKSRAHPQKQAATGAGGRKRKVESDFVAGGSKATTAPAPSKKRAKAPARNKSASPDEPRRSPMATSGSFQPDDPYDIPDSPDKGGPSKVSKKRTGKSVAAATKATLETKTDEPAPKKTSATARKRPRKPTGAAADDMDGEKRTLRPRKQMRRLPDGSDENEENDKADDDATHAIEPGQDAFVTDHLTQHHQDTMQIDEESRDTDEPQRTGDPKVKLEEFPPVASIEAIVDAPEEPRPVGSQFNAIVLSDRSELSSSIGMSPLPRPLPEPVPIKSKKPDHRHETPRAFDSSPPRAASRVGSQSLRGTGRSRKTQIISFDKTGPRNQGSAPKDWNTRASMPAMNVPVNWNSSASKHADPKWKKASSVATSIRSGKSNAAAPPSNVAHDVRDALAGLLGKTPLATSGPAGTINTAKVPALAPGRENLPVVNQDIDYGVDDDGFASINDRERFMNSPSPGLQLHAEPKLTRTASQTVMPPPERKVAPLTKAAEVVPSRKVMAAKPAVSTTVSPKRKAVPIQKPSEELPVQPSPPKMFPVPIVTSKASGKRPVVAEAPTDRPAKRVKTFSPRDVSAGRQAAKVSEASPKPTRKRKQAASSRDGLSEASAPDAVAERPAKRGKAASGNAAPAAPQPKQKTSTKLTATATTKEGLRKEKAASTDEVAHPVPPRHAPPKQNRGISQNSQTVDINGSPVPPDMELTESSTVLETFSQQADGSSSAAQESSNRPKTPEDAANAVGDDAYSVPPSHQQPSLSRNTKALPGPSGTSSKTMMQVKLSKAESEELLSKKKPRVASSDPFASSEQSQPVAAREKHKGPLLERTLNFAQQMGRTSKPNAGGAIEIIDITKSPEMEPRRPQKTVKKTAATNTTPELANKFASKLDRQVETLRKHTAFARGPEEEEDPDKTLVNDCSQVTEISKETDPESSSAEESEQATHEAAVEPELSSESSEDDDDDDLRTWRKGLKPHQLGLYEELVKVARVVTGYVAEQEDSADYIIDESYRRELLMIEQEEEVRKMQYKQYVTKLQLARKEKIRELKKLHDILQGVVDETSANWEEHRQGRAEKERVNQEVEELLGIFS